MLVDIDDPIIYVIDVDVHDNGATSGVTDHTKVVSQPLQLADDKALLLELSKEALADRLLAAGRDRRPLQATLHDIFSDKKHRR